jgi:hypothetical protein
MSALRCCDFGTLKGCRRGKRCEFLHVRRDATLALTRASRLAEGPWTRDAFRQVVHTKLQEYLEAVGSHTRVSGLAFVPDRPTHLAVRVSGVAACHGLSWQVSEERRLTFGGESFDLLPLPDSGTMTSGGPLFFHGTSFENGVQIMCLGKVFGSADPDMWPHGVYTSLERLPFYDRGCVLECASSSLLASQRLTKALRQADVADVPLGVVVRMKRSAVEYVHNPDCLLLMRVHVPMDPLCALLQVNLQGLPSYSAPTGGVGAVRTKASALPPRQVLQARPKWAAGPHHGLRQSVGEDARRVLTPSRSPRRPAAASVEVQEDVPPFARHVRTPSRSPRRRARALREEQGEEEDQHWGPWRGEP